MIKRSAPLVVGGALVLVFAWTVWPTLYHYHNCGPNNVLVRINRFSGAVEVLNDDGWKPTERPSTEPMTLERLRSLDHDAAK